MSRTSGLQKCPSWPVIFLACQTTLRPQDAIPRLIEVAKFGSCVEKGFERLQYSCLLAQLLDSLFDPVRSIR